MKHSVLRAAAHNAVDSLASGCSLAFGVYGFDLWSELRGLPDHTLKVELMSGFVSPPEVSRPRITLAFKSASGLMPDFLRKHGCNPDMVEAIEVAFEHRHLLHRAATISVLDKRGKFSSTQYQGWPLRRRRTKDALGRIRRG